jgi:hypothetical protein
VDDHIFRVLNGEGPSGPAPGVPPYRTVVYVPAHPRHREEGGPVVVGIELLTGPDGDPVPVAFTSTERLVAELGPSQPWVAAALGTFTEMTARAGLPPVRLDPRVPPEAASWRPGDLEHYTGEAGPA